MPKGTVSVISRLEKRLILIMSLFPLISKNRQVTLVQNPQMKIYSLNKLKYGYQFIFDQTTLIFRDTVVDGALPSLNGGSLQIVLSKIYIYTYILHIIRSGAYPL